MRDRLNTQQASELYFTTISVAEIEFRLRIMPDGKRRRLLAARFEQFLDLAFGERILTFDLPAARLYGEIRASRRAQGHPMSDFDAQIAAIARARSSALATRNIKDFEDCGVELINPFQ